MSPSSSSSNNNTMASSSSSSSSSINNANLNKIHAIYMALDAHQYHRAIKLAMALPKSNTLGQALLAHALAKISSSSSSSATTVATTTTTTDQQQQQHPHKREALVILCELLGESGHPELQRAKQRVNMTTTTAPSAAAVSASAHDATTTSITATTTINSTTTTTASSKKGKNHKQTASARHPISTLSSHHPPSNNNNAKQSQQSKTSNDVLSSEDDYLLTWLDDQQQRGGGFDDWVDVVASTSSSTLSSTSFPLDPVDETLLTTLAVTLGNLQLYWTIYHMYCHAAAALQAMTSPNHTPSATTSAQQQQQQQLLVMWLSKAYLAGLTVLVRMTTTVSSSTSTSIKLLNHCQVLALQLARYSGQGMHSSWAAQTAMWQYQQYLQQQQQQKDDESTIQQRMHLLPRLAESILSKRLGLSSSSPTTILSSSSSFPPIHPDELALYFETLTLQSKHEQLLAVVDDQIALLQQQQQQQQQDTASSSSSSSSSSPWTMRQLLEQRAKTLQDGIQDHNAAMQVYETLLQDNPDQWSYWKQYMRHDDDDEGQPYARTLALAKQFKERQQQQQQQEEKSPKQYPLRALDLVPVEVAYRQCLFTNTNTNNNITALFQAICQYGEIYASQAACTWADLHFYTDYVLEHDHHPNNKNPENSSWAVQLMDWAKTTFPRPMLQDGGDHDDDDFVLAATSRQLRAYMFGIQIQHQIVAKMGSTGNNTEVTTTTTLALPDWKEMVHTWHVWNVKNEDSKTVQAQKESRLGDELILLAVQQLLWQDENPHTLFTSAVLLEWALSKSPYNANLKLQAMDVYAALQATTRCWELFRDLSIKHIQVDSCTYLILPYLLDGGLFDEVIDVCRDIVRLHVSMVRDTAEYSTRAMEHGTLYKAQEFWTFQRERMTNSLSALQAKGLIFDAAPLLAVHQTSSSSGKGRGDDDSSSKEGKLYGSLGANHGIVGGESDLERAIQMIHELHNPFGAPRLVNMVASSSNADPSDDYSDNRDRGILAFQILHRRSNIPSKKEIVNSTFRRGHIHGLLIRAVLVMDATKGPKKGKLVKSSVQLEKRCSSLLQAVDSASQFIERWENEDSNERQHPALLSLVQSLFLVCRLVVVASAGLPDAPAQETMDRREARVTEMINLLLSQLTKAKTCLEESGSLSFPDCCRLLVDVLASLFALFKMASTILNVFGWGKRKCKTRPSAAAMAQAAAVFADVVKILYQSVDKSLPVQQPVPMDMPLISELEQYGVVFDPDSPKEVASRIAQAHRTSRRRVEPILDSMLQELATFQPEDA